MQSGERKVPKHVTLFYMTGFVATDDSFGQPERMCVLTTCTVSITNDPLIEYDSLFLKGKYMGITAGTPNHGN